MHPDLRRMPRLDAAARGALRDALCAAPWCWPRDEQRPELEHALDLVAGGPPELRVGQVPLVATSPTRASLWSLELADEEEGSSAPALGPEAKGAWREAWAVLPRALPVLWESLGRQRHPAMWIAPLLSQGERQLEGRSFGLSFLLALASRVLGRPLPEDVVASAAVTHSGALEPVEPVALHRKLLLVRHSAPRLRRFVMASAQPRRELEEAAPELQIVPAASCAAALEHVLGENLIQELLDAGHDPDRRRSLIVHLFHLGLGGRAAAPSWAPVERAVALALQEWKSLPPEQRRRLEMVRGIASRHEGGERVALPPLDPAWLRAQPAPLRLEVLAHYVQQGADTGSPEAEVLEPVVERFAVPLHEAHAPHLKLFGAVGRLRAVTGRPREALRLQEDLARAWLDALEYDQVSYPLSEWYRLAGACRDRSAFERAEEMTAVVKRYGGLTLDGGPYVTLARGRALVSLGRAADEEARHALEGIATASAFDAPDHVRRSATRWLVALLGDEAPLSRKVLRDVHTASEGADDDERRWARIFLALMALDAALGRSAHEDALQALERLQALQGGLVRNLVAAAPEGEAPSYVASFFPY